MSLGTPTAQDATTVVVGVGKPIEFRAGRHPSPSLLSLAVGPHALFGSLPSAARSIPYDRETVQLARLASLFDGSTGRLGSDGSLDGGLVACLELIRTRLAVSHLGSVALEPTIQQLDSKQQRQRWTRATATANTVSSGAEATFAHKDNATPNNASHARHPDPAATAPPSPWSTTRQQSTARSAPSSSQRRSAARTPARDGTRHTPRPTPPATCTHTAPTTHDPDPAGLSGRSSGTCRPTVAPLDLDGRGNPQLSGPRASCRCCTSRPSDTAWCSHGPARYQQRPDRRPTQPTADRRGRAPSVRHLDAPRTRQHPSASEQIPTPCHIKILNPAPRAETTSESRRPQRVASNG